jgi:hypothetical protein
MQRESRGYVMEKDTLLTTVDHSVRPKVAFIVHGPVIVFHDLTKLTVDGSKDVVVLGWDK